MSRSGTKNNPLKAMIALASMAGLAVMGSGALRSGIGGEQGIPGPRAMLWAFLPLAAMGWSMFRAWRREPRRGWQLFQLLALLAMTALAVQLNGGASSPAAALYCLLAFWTVHRTPWPWNLLVPVLAIMVETASSALNGRLRGETADLALLGILLALSFALAALAKGRRFRSGGPDRLEYDEPQEPLHDLRSDLQSLAGLIHAAMGARTTAVFLADEQGTTLRLSAFKSYSPEIARDASIEVERSFLGWVVRERQGLLYPRYQKDPRELGYYQGKESVGSILVMPVMEEHRVLGLVLVDSDQADRFGESDKLLLAGFAQEASRLVALNLKHTALGLEHERLREWNRRLEMMASRLKVADVVRIIQELVPQLVECDHLVLLELLQEVGRARVLLSDPAAAGGPAPGSEIDIRGTLSEQAFQLRQWRMVDDFYRRSISLARYTEDESRDHGFRTVLIGPLMYEDGSRYLLSMESRRPNAFEASLDTIHIVANQFSLALRSATLYEEKEALALHDGLTGLWNHRHFQEQLSAMLESGRKEPLSLALFDIDHFKKLNDTYGHPVGDVVLREVATRLRKHISKYDLAARYGGEEFAVIWPGSEGDQAERLARELMSAVSGRAFATPAGELKVTVSIGLAEYPSDAENKDRLIQAADQALYASKHGGRDRATSFRTLRPENTDNK